MGPVGRLRMGLVTREPVETSNPTHPTLGRGGRAETELYPSSWKMNFRKLPGWWTLPGSRKVTHPEKAWDLHACLSHTLPSASLPFHLAVHALYSYHKLVNINKGFSWVLRAILSNYQPCGRSPGNLWYIASWAEVQVAQALWLTSEMGGVFGDGALLTHGIWG